jgi:hypothetical protein
VFRVAEFELKLRQRPHDDMVGFYVWEGAFLLAKVSAKGEQWKKETRGRRGRRRKTRRKWKWREGGQSRRSGCVAEKCMKLKKGSNKERQSVVYNLTSHNSNLCSFSNVTCLATDGSQLEWSNLVRELV